MNRPTLLRCLILFASASSASLATAEQASDLHKRLNDPSPSVRERAALKLAERKDAAAILVLIDLLAELPAAERESVENMLKQLAGEWAPLLQFARDDEISRGVCRDAWASWWHNSDGPMLLAAVGKHTLTPDKRRKLQEFLAQLGNDDFKIRKEASEQLLAFGRLTLPYLHEAAKNSDLEAARRAKMLIERIEMEPDVRLPVAALRLLAVRKPAGAAEALLAYLPFAEDEIRQVEVRKSLVVLLRHEGERRASAPCFAALRHALTDAQVRVRIAAAEALIEGGGVECRAAVRRLLRETMPPIRMRLALAMARAGERQSVSALIELLPLLPAEEYGWAEEVLYQLAGDTAPELPAAAKSDDRKKHREAWTAWWKVNAERIDPSHLGMNSWLDYTVLCDNANSRVFEIDRHGKKLWSIGGFKNPVDAVVLPGNRVLIAECLSNRVSERDFKGNILWQMTVHHPVSVQPLPNGRTLIASYDYTNDGNPIAKVVEVDRAGKEIFSLGTFPGGIVAAYRWHQGNIVCVAADGQCRIFDAAGKKLKSFDAGRDNNIYALDLRSNGHILITHASPMEVVEFDSEGRLLLQLSTPWAACIASQLPNGHVLLPCNNPPGAYEMDRSGKIVWRYKGAGAFIRARRR